MVSNRRRGRATRRRKFNLIRASFLLVAIALGGSSASAMPLAPRASFAAPDNLVNVKIVCEQDGRCFKVGRRPVARWVYGEGNFYGPYVGPGYYGPPGNHRVSFFGY